MEPVSFFCRLVLLNRLGNALHEILKLRVQHLQSRVTLFLQTLYLLPFHNTIRQNRSPCKTYTPCLNTLDCDSSAYTQPKTRETS